MLKLVCSTAELDAEQLLDIYKGQGIDEADFLNYLRTDFFCQRDAFYALWNAGGRHVAALRIEPYADGLLLESLSTAPENRRQGYAFMLVTKVLEYLKTTPYRVLYAHIDKKNLPSLSLHKKCGFVMFSDSAKYIDGTVTQKSCTMCYYL